MTRNKVSLNGGINVYIVRKRKGTIMTSVGPYVREKGRREKAVKRGKNRCYQILCMVGCILTTIHLHFCTFREG